MEQLLRSLFQSMAKSKSANKWAKRYGLHLGAKKFVAGETIESAIQVIQQLNKQGMAATLDHLGEFVSDQSEARASADYGIRTLEAIHRSGVNSSLSLKL